MHCFEVMHGIPIVGKKFNLLSLGKNVTLSLRWHGIRFGTGRISSF